jgi:hypothetical protein
MVAHQLCDRSLSVWRAGEPMQASRGQTALEADTYILNPILYAGHTTLLYGPGDSGKSLFGVAAALLLAQGGCLAGFAAAGGFVPLTLDWERSYDTFDSRVRALTMGHQELLPASEALWYRRLHQSLPECIEDIQDALATNPVDVLIIDSLGMASGGDLNAAESATSFFDALRSLDKPALVIGHTHKLGEDKTIFGSVFFYNLASVVWEVVADHEENSNILKLGMFCRKNNLGPRPKPIGLSLTFADGKCTLGVADLQDSATISKKLSRVDRICHALSDHEGRTVAQIANEIGDTNEHAIRTELNRYKGKYWHKVDELWVKL